MLNLLRKIIWAFINLVPIKPSSTLDTLKIPKHQLLVLTLEYDKFKDRSIKTLKYGVSYPCGQQTHEIIKEYCQKNLIPLCRIMTSDSIKESPTELLFDDIQWIPNLGTDIAALENLSGFLENYENIIIVNSSANFKQAHLIEKIISQLLENKQNNVIIGPNANQRYSPTFPIISPICPHIISNFFACNTKILLTTIHHAQRSLIYRWLGGYGNKYVAIRLFELLLSRHALAFHGDLILINENKVMSYKNNPKEWPKNDSRLFKY